MRRPGSVFTRRKGSKMGEYEIKNQNLIKKDFPDSDKEGCVVHIYDIPELSQETLYLNSIPNLVESILEGGNTPVDECLSEDEIEDELKLDEERLLRAYERSKNEETYSHEDVWKKLRV